MSDAALAYVEREHREEPFSDSELAVARTLARRADPTTHQVQVTCRELCAEVRKHERYMRTLLKRLQARGLITAHYAPAGQSHPAPVYTFARLLEATPADQVPILLAQRRVARQQRVQAAQMRARTEDRLHHTGQRVAQTTRCPVEHIQQAGPLPGETLQQILLFMREHFGAS